MLIVTCPACRTRYRVDQHELGEAAGRPVRCANCGHTWQQAPPAILPPSGAALPRLDHSRGDATVADAPRPPSLRILDDPQRPPPGPPRYTESRRWPALVWLAPIIVALLLGLAVLAGIVGRGRVVALWPSAARLYAWIGRPAEPSGPGLVIGKIMPTRTADGLTIAGEIVNLGNAPRDVPRLRVALQDATGKELQFELVDPPKPRLLPGEVVHFDTPFPNPVDAASGVVVTFAPS